MFQIRVSKLEMGFRRIGCHGDDFSQTSDRLIKISSRYVRRPECQPIKRLLWVQRNSFLQVENNCGILSLRTQDMG
ncbi:MAG: hypothetical protein DMG08_27710 [Acidobacteria bacterium]|nr:MAG: hypothetical protein DMG08_27710 [Acidobacteriota bacterium]